MREPPKARTFRRETVQCCNFYRKDFSSYSRGPIVTFRRTRLSPAIRARSISILTSTVPRERSLPRSKKLPFYETTREKQQEEKANERMNYTHLHSWDVGSLCQKFKRFYGRSQKFPRK